MHQDHRGEGAARVVVIGAGPAGLGAAYALAKEGVAVRVIEGAREVGGLSRSFDLWGQRVDVGPHRFFSEVPEINALFREILGDAYTWVPRLSRILYRGRFFRYPLEIGDVIQNLGPIELARCLASYAAARAAPSREASSFEGWVASRFGRRLYELFFEGYTEKLWGIPPSQIDAAWAAERIKGLSLAEAVAQALSPRRPRPRTLVESFPYPREGTGTLYTRLAARIEAMGGRIELGKAAARVVVDGARVTGVRTRDGELIPASHVISTMPLTQLVQGLSGAPPAVLEAAGALRFRHTILVYLEVGAREVFADNWVYVHAPELSIGRVTNFRSFCPSLTRGRPTTILAAEIWCSEGDGRWSEPDDVMANLAAREVVEAGLAGGAPILRSHVLRVRKSYPVYEIGYRRRVEDILSHLHTIDGLHAIGRGGSFRYQNQDHALHMGLDAARAVITGRRGVDREGEGAYQERGRISETGLVQ